MLWLLADGAVVDNLGRLDTKLKNLGIILEIIGGHWKSVSREGSNQEAYIMVLDVFPVIILFVHFNTALLGQIEVQLKGKNRLGLRTF